MQYGGAIYILTNHSNTVLYLGVTSDLYARVIQHRDNTYPDSFTAKYNCYKLGYYESFSRIEEAIATEKIMKKWKRQWKLSLINQFNPEWKDLLDTL
jgi:putative endonuclease